MRTFIAVDFNKDIKNAIKNLQDRLRVHASRGRWKYVDNFHLTLKFLGEIDERKADEVGAQLEEISQKNSRFVLNITEIGRFQGYDSIRVLWLGLGGDLNELSRLQADVEDGMYAIGFAKEKRPYVPHITIAQDISFSTGFDEIRKMASEIVFPSIPVDKILLFKSEQVGRKRIYTPLQEIRFKKDI